MSDRLFSGNACDEGSNELPQHTYLKRRKASYNLEEYDAIAGPSNTIVEELRKNIGAVKPHPAIMVKV